MYLSLIWFNDTASAPTNNPTLNPTTSVPITSVPTTTNPTTSAPTTTNPTTSDPTTSSPTTSAPTTSDPTTPNPTTSNPTTPTPITSNPTTSAPTTPSQNTSSTVCIANLSTELNGEYAYDGDANGVPSWKKIGNTNYYIYWYEQYFRITSDSTKQSGASNHIAMCLAPDWNDNTNPDDQTNGGDCTDNQWHYQYLNGNNQWLNIYVNASVKLGDCINPLPTLNPTTSAPTTSAPTINPITIDPTTAIPTNNPTLRPSKSPLANDKTHSPTTDPINDPTKDPTTNPTNDPTVNPTLNPTTSNPTMGANRSNNDKYIGLLMNGEFDKVILMLQSQIPPSDQPGYPSPKKRGKGNIYIFFP